MASGWALDEGRSLKLLKRHPNQYSFGASRQQLLLAEAASASRLVPLSFWPLSFVPTFASSELAAISVLLL